jgi:prolyl-tRNA editing enzyme YbaK/EbsC (Cys-tRNA(Pro) deacylase)
MEQNQISAQCAPGVQKALTKHGVDCAVIELSDSTRTASDAAAELGCDVGQIVKSLIYKTQSMNQPVLVLASGLNRVNERSVEHQLGEEITKANADFARDFTGFAIGGIPPVGHKKSIKLIFIDKDLLEFDTVWAAAGTPNSVFNITGTDLVAMTNGKVISIK